MQTDLDEIRAFLALAHAGSFLGAGKLINRDPAVVTRRLHGLEQRLGVRLVERTTRRVALTEAGQAYLARVGPMVEGLEAAEREVAGLGAGEARGHLRITLPGSFGRMWIAPMLIDFLLAHPAVSMEANVENRFIDLVAEGYDLAIRLGELPDSRLVARRVADRRRLICASPAYLARHPAIAEPQHLQGHACLCNSERTPVNQWRFKKPDGGIQAVTVNQRMASGDSELLVKAALAGLGVMHTSDWYVSQYLASGELVEVLPAYPIADKGAVYLVTPAAAGMPGKTRAFSDWIAGRLQSPPWLV
ncbi:LysR family transcriptional regulator [Bordetella sp. N]|uniref:LysR family transcriptional regulator n=1 Tax=Bordetella sp. N TaxID=1746199 RepID=UPI00070D843B|nr:LysR family transcriptional regulator [Bordetella sp. N]ALM86546.1 transcriptional regulator [Bordetella sp. N]